MPVDISGPVFSALSTVAGNASLTELNQACFLGPMQHWGSEVFFMPVRVITLPSSPYPSLLGVGFILSWSVWHCMLLLGMGFYFLMFSLRYLINCGDE